MASDIVGAPVIDANASECFLRQFDEFQAAPFTHAKGEPRSVERFDESLRKLLADFEQAQALEKEVKSLRQDLTDALYLGDFQTDAIAPLVSAGMRDIEFQQLVEQQRQKVLGEVKLHEKEWGVIESELKAQKNDSFRYQSTNDEIDSLIRQVFKMDEQVANNVSIAEPAITAEIAQLREDVKQLTNVERDLEGDKKEKKIRQKNCNSLVPEVNAYAAWMHKNSMLLRHEADDLLQYNRRIDEGSKVDPFWGPLEKGKQVRVATGERKAKKGVEVDIEVEMTSEDLIEIADHPVMISFGDSRALRPKYMPATGSAGACNKNAMAPLGVDPDHGILDGNNLFFEIPTVGTGDSTKMELVRKMFIEALLHHGGEHEPVAQTIHGLSEMDENEMSPMLNVFSRHEKMQRSSEAKFKMSIDDTYMLERSAGAEGWHPPSYLETHEVWFGAKLPPPTTRRIRFVVYSVRKRSKKPEKQKILWMGIMAVRRQDVQDLYKLTGHTEIGDDGALTGLHGAITIDLSAIVGKDVQRRIADAFVLLDIERKGTLTPEEVRLALVGEQDHGHLGLNVEHFDEVLDHVYHLMQDQHRQTKLRGATSVERNKMLDAEAAGELNLRDLAPLAELEMTYEQFETLAIEYINFDEVNGKSNAMIEREAAKREHLTIIRGHELNTLFDRFDADHSGALEVKELYVALGVLGFTGLNPKLVHQLMEQYDKNGNNQLEREEFISLTLDALCLMEPDKTSWDMIMDRMNPPEPLIVGRIDHAVHDKAGLFFGRTADDGQYLEELAFEALGNTTMYDGFSILCKTEETSTRDRWNDESYRMELVRLMVVTSFVRVQAGQLVEDQGHSFETVLHAMDGTAMTGKIDETRRLQNYKRRVDARTDGDTATSFIADDMQFLLEKQPPNEKLWEHADITLQHIDLIKVEQREPLFPTYKTDTFIDIYECRYSKSQKLIWLLVLLKRPEDADYVSHNFAAAVVPTAGQSAGASGGL